MSRLQIILADWRWQLLQFAIRLVVAFLVSPWVVLLPRAIPTCLNPHAIPYDPDQCIIWVVGFAPWFVFGSLASEEEPHQIPWLGLTFATVMIALAWTVIRLSIRWFLLRPTLEINPAPSDPS